MAVALPYSHVPTSALQRTLALSVKLCAEEGGQQRVRFKHSDEATQALQGRSEECGLLMVTLV